MDVSQQAEVDSLVRHLLLLPHHHFASLDTEPCMSCLIWKDGITSFTDLPAKSKVGITRNRVKVSLIHIANLKL
jgi:hypothetical protein